MTAKQAIVSKLRRIGAAKDGRNPRGLTQAQIHNLLPKYDQATVSSGLSDLVNFGPVESHETGRYRLTTLGDGRQFEREQRSYIYWGEK